MYGVGVVDSKEGEERKQQLQVRSAKGIGFLIQDNKLLYYTSYWNRRQLTSLRIHIQMSQFHIWAVISKSTNELSTSQAAVWCQYQIQLNFWQRYFNQISIFMQSFVVNLLVIQLGSPQTINYPTLNSGEILISVPANHHSEFFQFQFSSKVLQSEWHLNPLFLFDSDNQQTSIKITRKCFEKLKNFYQISASKNLARASLKVYFASFAFNSDYFKTGHFTVQLDSLSSNTFILPVSFPPELGSNQIIFINMLEGFQINVGKRGKVGQYTHAVFNTHTELTFSNSQKQLSRSLFYGYMLIYSFKYNQLTVKPNQLIKQSEINSVVSSQVGGISILTYYVFGFRDFEMGLNHINFNSETSDLIYTMNYVRFNVIYRLHQIQNCATDNHLICISCIVGYYLQNGLCLACPKGCSVCDSSNVTNCFINCNSALTQKTVEAQKAQKPEKLICKEGTFLYQKQQKCLPCLTACKSCLSRNLCFICKVDSALLDGICIQVTKPVKTSCAWPYQFQVGSQSCVMKKKSIESTLFDKVSIAKELSKIVSYFLCLLPVMGYSNLLEDLIGLSVIVKSHLIFTPLLQLQLGSFLSFFSGLFSITNLLQISYTGLLSKEFSQYLDSTEKLIFPDGYFLLVTTEGLVISAACIIVRVAVSNALVMIFNEIMQFFKKGPELKLSRLKGNIFIFVYANVYQIIFLALNQTRIFSVKIKNITAWFFAVFLVALSIMVFYRKRWKKPNGLISFLLFLSKLFIISQTVLQRNQEYIVYLVLVNDVLALGTIIYFRKNIGKPLERSCDFLLSICLCVSNYFALQKDLKGWVIYLSVVAILLNLLVLGFLLFRKMIKQVLRWIKGRIRGEGSKRFGRKIILRVFNSKVFRSQKLGRNNVLFY